MTGKLTIMTIITGVKSPWILGKDSVKQDARAARSMMNDELGIRMV
jgi:hypothetical protein